MHPGIGVLLVTLGSWPLAVVATCAPIDQVAVSVHLLSQFGSEV